MWLSALFATGRKQPQRAPGSRRIKVIEKPGADYPAQPHARGNASIDCWCLPDLEETEDEILVTHRTFDN